MAPVHHLLRIKGIYRDRWTNNSDGGAACDIGACVSRKHVRYALSARASQKSARLVTLRSAERNAWYGFPHRTSAKKVHFFIDLTSIVIAEVL
jgi:hypothetical protein